MTAVFLSAKTASVSGLRNIFSHDMWKLNMSQSLAASSCLFARWAWRVQLSWLQICKTDSSMCRLHPSLETREIVQDATHGLFCLLALFKPANRKQELLRAEPTEEEQDEDDEDEHI